MVDALEFRPQTGKQSGTRTLTATHVRSPKGGDPTVWWLAAIAAACIGGGVLLSIMSEKPDSGPVVEDNVSAPPPPPRAQFKEYDNRISNTTRWIDDPIALAKELEFFGSIFHNTNPALSVVQIGPKLRKVGETCGDKNQFTVIRIDRYVVFLRDKQDRIRRLIDPARWDYVRKEYRWPELPELPPREDEGETEPNVDENVPDDQKDF